MTMWQKCLWTSATLLALAGAGRVSSAADDRSRIVTIDRYVPVRSTVPSMAGRTAAIYVRERARMSTIADGALHGSRAVVFIHGSGTPAEVAFDVPYQDYSWMAFLAEAGHDVFAADMTGYGRSTRPLVMNDPCNLTVAQQTSLFGAPCAPSYTQQATTLASDWNDIGAVVDHVRALRRVDKVTLIGWSLGASRSMGYAATHLDVIDKLIELAPAYGRAAASTPPPKVPADGAAFNTQSHAEFAANWDRQVGCQGQYEPAAREAIWSTMLASDPLGATWGSGVRRAPNVTAWGWNQAAAAQIAVPTLLVSGVHDKQVAPERVRELYADLGAQHKVFVDLACSSHNAMWETNRLLLFRASLEWIASGMVNGAAQGLLSLGY